MFVMSSHASVISFGVYVLNNVSRRTISEYLFSLNISLTRSNGSSSISCRVSDFDRFSLSAHVRHLDFGEYKKVKLDLGKRSDGKSLIFPSSFTFASLYG